MATLPFSDIVTVAVNVGATSTIRSTFNVGLIIGSSDVISKDDRIKSYSQMEDMTSDGWKGNEPEYLAAQLYFSQNPKPLKLCVGRWDKTQDTGETAVQAVAECRSKNSEWYACTVCDAEESDIEAIADYIESATPTSTYFATVKSTAVINNAEDNICAKLKTKGIKRTLIQYSTQNNNAVASIMGYAMGANTQTLNSAFVLAYKSEPGVTVEDINTTQLNTLIKTLNCNVYVNVGAEYNLFRQGIMCNGVPFDEILGIDILQNGLQSSIIDLLAKVSKIPQTDSGTEMINNALTSPLEKSKKTDFIAPGKWNGSDILSVKNGDYLASGYVIISDSIADQEQSDREARKAPNTYVICKLSGSIEHLAISVSVDR